MATRRTASTYNLLRVLFPQNPSPGFTAQRQRDWDRMQAEEREQLQAIREIGALVVAVLAGHDDHCGGTCRTMLSTAHDCCYICNVAEMLARDWRRYRSTHWDGGLPEEMAEAVMELAEGGG